MRPSKDTRYTRKQWLMLALPVVLAAAALVSGVTIAWFGLSKSLSTVAGVQKPAEIEILDPGEKMVQMDLSYTENEKSDDGTVTIYRPFVVRSETENYILYLAHTTNIAGLDIQLFPAVTGSQNNHLVTGVDANNQAYFWSVDGLTADHFQNGKLKDTEAVTQILRAQNIFDASGYINPGSTGGNGNTLAQDNDVLYDLNFDQGQAVQEYAVPLYWAARRTGTQAEGSGKYVSNYILRLSWKETEKETDILYLIAKTTKSQSSD